MRLSTGRRLCMTDALARATALGLLLVTENAVLTRCVGGVPRQTLGVAAAESVNAVLECVSVTRDSLDVDFVRKFVQTFRDYKAGAPPSCLTSSFIRPT